eukprot:952336-Alexandrium_andersonii.AAC.1
MRYKTSPERASSCTSICRLSQKSVGFGTLSTALFCWGPAQAVQKRTVQKSGVGGADMQRVKHRGVAQCPQGPPG